MKDNTPAFPVTEANGANSGLTGITIRDYFAAKAMQAYVAQGKGYDFADIAAVSYRQADEMMKVRTE